MVTDLPLAGYRVVGRARFGDMRDVGVAGWQLVDGDNAMGHLVIAQAAETAVALARETGLAWVGTRNSNHAGCAGIYAEIPMRAGMIGIMSAVANANHMAVWGGAEMLLGTNPVAFAVPAAVDWRIDGSVWPYVLGSAVFELVYIALLAAAYRESDLSLIYPLGRGVAPVLVLVVGVAALGPSPGVVAALRDDGLLVSDRPPDRVRLVTHLQITDEMVEKEFAAKKDTHYGPAILVHEFHVAFERVSRSLWAPAADSNSQETRWFYERARGQYTDKSAEHKTRTAQSKFKMITPSRQRFSKSDLATFVHSWEQLPYWVSRGAQKNFAHFMERIENSDPVVDVQYCKRAIATALLFQAADRIARGHSAGSHKRLITTYTVARLSLAAEKRIDLDRIWNEQNITDALKDALDELCPLVMETVVSSDKHVSEWAKKPDCWDEVSRISWTLPESLAAELTAEPFEIASSESTESDEAESAVEDIPSEKWQALADWAREGRVLRSVDRQLADRVSQRLSQGRRVTGAQARQAMEVYEEALRHGFHPVPDGLDHETV